MSNNTNNQATFPIYINGELSPDYIAKLKRIKRKQAAQLAAKTTIRATHGLANAIMTAMGGQFRQMVYLVELDAHDSKFGTQLRAEYFKRKSDRAELALKDKMFMV